MGYKEEIEIYGEDIQDFETSPFEAIDLLQRRTRLQRNIEQLSPEEKKLLRKYDGELLKAASKMVTHLNKVYNFSHDKPLEEWWWHLDKVANHQLSVDIEQGLVSELPFLRTVVEFESKEAYELFVKWSKDKKIIIRQTQDERQRII